MDKIWYIIINGREEGPFSFRDLLYDARITPKTLAWKEGYDKWIPIDKIPELKELFEEPPPPPKEDEEEGKKKPKVKVPFDELALDYNTDPSGNLLWILLAILILISVIYKIYWFK